jgi:putative DNA primase/helicase
VGRDAEAAGSEGGLSVTPISKAKKRDAWRTGLRLTKNDKPKVCLANTLHVLATHPDWDDVIAHDAFAEVVVCTREPPTRPQDRPSATMIGDWTDEHSIRTAAWIAQEADFDPQSSLIDQAVATLAQKNVRHPVREYLRAVAVQWDGTPKLDGMLPDYFGTADTPYTRAIGSRWMISAVARVMQPGCQVDCMIVLEGLQGQRKSTGLEALCPRKEWFADTGVDIGSKDSFQSLRRKLFYEFGELDSIKRNEITRIKNFVSARTDNYRPSYGRRNRDFARQVVFAGTTNEENYLVDKTGNRRFWPVRCFRRVDVDGLVADRDQLWAEAFARYEAGEAWHVDTPELQRLCEAEQRKREAPDDWEPIVETWLKFPTLPDGAGGRIRVGLASGVTTHEALLGAIEIRKADINHAQTIRMGKVLGKLGYVARQQREGHDRARRYTLGAVTVGDSICDVGDCDTEAASTRPNPCVSQMSHTICIRTHEGLSDPLPLGPRNLIGTTVTPGEVCT